MTKLIDKVKPEVLKYFERHTKVQYSSSYKYLISSLEDTNRYRDLTIEQVNNLITFLPEELHPDGRADFYYGDYILQKKYQV